MDIIGVFTFVNGFRIHCIAPQEEVFLDILSRVLPVPIEMTLKSLMLCLGFKYFIVLITAAIDGLFTITPPSIKSLYEGKYAGAAELAIAASITLKS